MLSNVFFLALIHTKKNMHKQTDSTEVRQVIQERHIVPEQPFSLHKSLVNESWEQPAFQSKDSKPLGWIPVGLYFFLKQF